MRVETLRTLGFRNLAPAEVRLSDRVTLLHGANGAGKTNLLEALYAALAGRSCRTRSERETIAFAEPLARAEAVVADHDERREFLYAVDRSAGKRHLLNGNAVTAAGSFMRPALAVFMPDRLTLVKGPPAARRSHLDGFIAALRPARAGARARYARALAQRNALLGRIRSGAPGSASLDAWDAELAGAGIELMEARADAVDVLAPAFAEAAADLGLGQDAAIAYRPRSQGTTAEELAAELGERRESDLARGFSGHGPHLDELRISIARRPARRYASQGQQRTALLALLFAERDALLADSLTPPLMLLDDVTSELDPSRRGLLCERLLAGDGQALITATEAGHLPRACPRLELAVREGAVFSTAETDRADAA
ncbi:MAG: DNA replication and repair protein RecF [Actinomycetota bacterium]|nr:DNA replication and repair protein RecF [Actinomycetota bacterium]